jgi:molybdopterin converting factor small subunit
VSATCPPRPQSGPSAGPRPGGGEAFRVDVEVLSWVNKFVGGPGTGEIVVSEEAERGASVRTLLRRVTDRHPELGRALWDPDRPREIGDNIEVMVNNAVLGVSHDLDSELAPGDRITLLGQYIGGSGAAPGRQRERRWRI